jgi:NAD(P)-dependent dehydrogenase (short-subunit alcohol dehydrogenase family)
VFSGQPPGLLRKCVHDLVALLVLDVILRGEISGMNSALGVMQPAGTGTIINVASALGVRSRPPSPRSWSAAGGSS